MQVRKQQLEVDMEQQTGSKWEKEYVKAVYCHPAYLTSMQSTSWGTERVTGRKARGLQMEELGFKGQTFFLSLLSIWRKQSSVTFFPFSTNFKERFFLKFCVAVMTPGSTWI